MTAQPAAATSRVPVVVMGVTGSGKTTVGEALAHALELPFLDGDSLHSVASVERMRAGIALTDDDRWPWLDRIGARLGDAGRGPGGLVVACSALRRSYRDRLRAAAPGLRFVFLDGSRDLLDRRLGTRSGHYMPRTLLASQLETLERPAADEDDVLHLLVDEPVAQIVARAATALRGRCG